MDPKLEKSPIKSALYVFMRHGWFRHAQYYERTITETIKELFVRMPEDLKDVKDVAIATFSSMKTRRLVLNK